MQLLCIPFWLVSIAKPEKRMLSARLPGSVAFAPGWLLTLAKKKVILSPMETASARVHGPASAEIGVPAGARTSAEVGVWAGARIGAANSTLISARISAAASAAAGAPTRA